jgi:four helix bundle protein
MDLVEEVYKVTRSLPPDERFGLTSQIRRCAVSIPANIAEGHGRKSTGAFANHLSIASGSVAELETHLMLCQRLGFIASPELEELMKITDEIGRMLTGLKRSLTRS